MTEEAKTGLELAIAEAEVAVAKENETIAESGADTTPAPEPETIAGTEGTDTIEAPAEDTIEAAIKEPEPKPKKKPWFMDTISEQRERARKAEAERDAALELLKKAPTTPEEMAEQEIDRRAQAKATQMVQGQTFNQKVFAVGDKGREKYEDFNDAANALHAIGLTNDQFLDVVADLPNAPDILYHLGTNPEEALALSKMPPVKQALELARMEMKLTKPVVQKQVSRAAAPVKPIVGNSNTGYVGNEPEKLLTSDEGVTKFWDSFYKRK